MTESEENTWMVEWLSGVASSPEKMSQRKLSSIEREGGLEQARRIAEQAGVHLLLLTDEHDNELVAASTKPFTVIC